MNPQPPIEYHMPNLNASVNNRELLFADKLNTDQYWEALIQIANNNIDKANEITFAINSGSAIELDLIWKETRPGDINSFFDKLFISSVFEDPEILSYLGLFESIGIRDHNRRLNDVSVDAIIRNFERQKNNLKILQTYPQNALSKEQLISYKIFSWKLNHETAGEKFLFHEYMINQIFGVLQNLTQLFTQFHKLGVAEDFDNYIIRLNMIPKQLQQAIDTMKYQQQNGILPPKFTIEKVINITKYFISVPASENIFYTHLSDMLEKSEISDKTKMLAIAKAAISETVYPAYKMLQYYLETLLPIAKTNNGVWALPDGDAYYSYMLKEHTTTDLTAEEIHKIGLEEVSLIQDEMRKLLNLEGIENPEKEVGELMRELAENDRFYYPNTDKGQEECLKDYEEILKRSRKELWPLFDIKPSSSVKIQPIPKHEEEGAPGAYYNQPSIDGTRPGVFFVNLRDMRENPKYRMETLSIHEAEPGHHFQCTLQNEMKIPVLRKLGSYTAYVEGWALYTEKLGLEHGFYTSTFDQLGHLQDELLRAARLVIDTGIHKKKWSREKAIDYMVKTTGITHDSVVTEVERYFVMPGQACAYKIGQMKILELRQRAQDQLGDKFDIRKFHNVVLNLAAAPLTILEEVVDDYIKKNKREQFND